jgi:predicted nucleic acid-binding protein
LYRILHPGEAAAVCLAVEIQPDALLIDEADGRIVACNLGLRSQGIVGVLPQAKRVGRLPLVRPLLSQLSESGFYLAPAFLTRIIAQAGE